MTLGGAELGRGHFDAAIDEYKKGRIDAGWRAYQPYRGLAPALRLDGRMEEAASALAEARRLNPQLTLKWQQSHSVNIPPLLEGLRKAGLPEELNEFKPAEGRYPPFRDVRGNRRQVIRDRQESTHCGRSLQTASPENS